MAAILTEMRNRGVQELVPCVDGLKGFPEAIGGVPEDHGGVVHRARGEEHLGYVNWKESKAVAQDLRTIYRAATADEAEQRLTEFEARWDAKCISIGKMWRHWAGIVPLFAFPEETRRAIYTTNVVESVHMSLRKG